MKTTSAGQVTHDAAEVYDAFFVPALFQTWTTRVAEAARLAPGDEVLDVACGTGALALEAARRVAPSGSVAGLDRNEGMLAVARRKAPGIAWRQGLAEALPYPDGSFDAVVSQFGLMFFEDRPRALREMRRVLKPGGRMAVAVWDALDRSPGYAAMTALLQRLFGDRAAAALRAPFALGDPQRLAALFEEAGIAGARLRSVEGEARFASLATWVHTDVNGWALAGMIDDAQYRRLQAAAKEELVDQVQPDGSVVFAAPAHIVTATR